jgi:chromosomal replication initiator protein
MNKTAQSVWENCLSFIKDNIQDQAYKTWFEPIKSVELTDNALYIQVPSKFFYEWLEEHYVKLLKVALTKELGKTQSYFIKLRWKTLMAINNLLRNNCQVPIGLNETTKCRCSL